MIRCLISDSKITISPILEIEASFGTTEPVNRQTSAIANKSARLESSTRKKQCTTAVNDMPYLLEL